MKLAQLRRICRVLQITEAQFFNGDVYPEGSVYCRQVTRSEALRDRAIELNAWLTNAEQMGLSRADVADLFTTAFAAGSHLRRVS